MTEKKNERHFLWCIIYFLFQIPESRLLGEGGHQDCQEDLPPSLKTLQSSQARVSNLSLIEPRGNIWDPLGGTQCQ